MWRSRTEILRRALFVRDPTVRDPNAVKRRRRLLMIPTDAPESVHGAAPQSTAATSSPAEPLQQLFAECQGKTGLQLLVEVTGQAHALKQSLDQPFVTVGSGPQCDVRIERTGVLPCHAYVQWIEGRLFCWGQGLQAPAIAAWLDRKPVDFGPFRLSIPGVEPRAKNPADPQSKNSDLATEVLQVQLKFGGVEQQDNLWPVDRTVTLIGRGPQCKLRLDHPDVPVLLACLIRRRSSCWLINLDRRESVHVNDHPLRFQSLDIGDRLRLGPFPVEVCAAPFSLKSPPAPQTKVRELATRHRQRLGALDKSLNAVQVYLDDEHLNAIPELKTALQQYVARAQRYHREMQEALEKLSDG